jgi:hypothetical protein
MQSQSMQALAVYVDPSGLPLVMRVLILKKHLELLVCGHVGEMTVKYL